MLHRQYYVEKEKQERLLARKNEKSAYSETRNRG